MPRLFVEPDRDPPREVDVVAERLEEALGRRVRRVLREGHFAYDRAELGGGPRRRTRSRGGRRATTVRPLPRPRARRRGARLLPRMASAPRRAGRSPASAPARLRRLCDRGPRSRSSRGSSRWQIPPGGFGIEPSAPTGRARAMRQGPARTSNTVGQSALHAPQRVHRDASTRSSSLRVTIPWSPECDR